MASGYTTHYGLCQWQPTDKFLREEFNQDNEKIDSALGQAEAKADRALSGLEAADYNIYNLLLQNEYEGKYTGYKKALLFDGFADESGIDSVSGVNFDGPNRSLVLDGLGQQQDAVAFGTSGVINLHAGKTTSGTWTATGNGTLIKAELYVTGTATLELYQGNQFLGSATASQNNYGSICSFTFSVPVTAGTAYRLVLTAGDGGITLQVSGSSAIGFRLNFTPVIRTSGSVTTGTFSTGEAQGALAWVRHQNGSVACSIRSGGTWLSMSPAGTRSTVNLDGESCTESSFRLEQAVAAGTALRLSLTTPTGKRMRVYDYGAALL